jgi:hypothetical protein
VLLRASSHSAQLALGMEEQKRVASQMLECNADNDHYHRVRRVIPIE